MPDFDQTKKDEFKAEKNTVHVKVTDDEADEFINNGLTDDEVNDELKGETVLYFGRRSDR